MEKQESFREERIRNMALSYYSRKDIKEAILNFAQNREIVPRYFEGFGKRPDTLQYESEIFELAKKGATSFHCSEEIWKDPLALETGMSAQSLNSLRQGWDLLIDVDSKYLDYSKIAADLLIRALRYNGVKQIGVKFSGNKGFHIIVPWKSFPKKLQDKETKDMFPEIPRAICLYLTDMIKKELIEKITDLMVENRKSYVKDFEAPEQVMPDIILVSSRHLFRMPYSLHEKTALSSIVINPDKILDFNLSDANPLKVKPVNFIPNSEEGESAELLQSALDHKPVENKIEHKINNQFNQPSNTNKQFQEIITKDITPELYPPSIKLILGGIKADGRKRALFVLLGFFRSLKFEQEAIEKIIDEWNNKNYKPLEPGYIKAQIVWAFKNKILPPPNFDKPYYSGIGINPTEEEIRAKNPLSYLSKKLFFLQHNTKSKKKSKAK